MEKGKNKLGKLIANLREEKCMTQKDLAEKLMVSDKTISRWENGGSLPDMEDLNLMSKFFKISLSDLAILRLSSKDENEEIVEKILEEFSRQDKNRRRIIKIILVVFLSIIIFLIGVIIFTASYNKFKVYSVTVISDDLHGVFGEYVETKMKDTLYLNNIIIKDYTLTNKDIVSVDLYYVENDKEVLLHSFSRLDNIKFVSYESYIKIDDLTKYLDSLYIRITIIDSKNNEHIYNGKLVFVLDFSNSKLYNNKEDLKYGHSKSMSADEIRKILLANGFEKDSNDVYNWISVYEQIYYVSSLNKFYYVFVKNKLNYKYVYNVGGNTLEVWIYDDNNVDIENYTYDITNDRVTSCVVGKCNGYKEAMKILNDKVLYLLNK